MEVGRVTADKACDCTEPNGYVFLPKGYKLGPCEVGRDSFWYVKDGKLTGMMLDTSRKRTCRYCKATLRRPK
jgi:hypothetical protein